MPGGCWLLCCSSWSSEWFRRGSSSSSEPPGAVSCSSAHASIGRLEAEKKCFFHSTLPAITAFLSSLYLKKSSLLPGPEVSAFLSAALTATRLLGFSSSRALKFLTGWGFFPYLQLSTWDSIFFFLCTSFQEPCKQKSRLWDRLGTHPSPEPCESGQLLFHTSNTRSYFKSTANYNRKMTLQP